MDLPDSPELLAQPLLDAVARMHRDNSREPIRFPSLNGAFPDDILLRPPPVVPDANRLRNDVLRACRTGQRTVLVNAANGGLVRLLCAQHVVDEVDEHSARWAASGPVPFDLFRHVWLNEYLPLIRVIQPHPAHLMLLSPAEAKRMGTLAAKDDDDVPSATLALLLEAFYLSNDRPALTAVYGEDADLTEHAQWVEILKAGGDAGELGKMVTFTANLSVLAGSGIIGGIKRLASATSPWLLIAAGVFATWRLVAASDATKQSLRQAGASALTYILAAYLAYEEVRTKFAQATPAAPSWAALAETNPPAAVLARACMHTLARSTRNDLSAEELARQLPNLDVPQGEAKVRGLLRGMDCFTEVRRGRWQLGAVARPVTCLLAAQEAVNPRKIASRSGQMTQAIDAAAETQQEIATAETSAQIEPLRTRLSNDPGSTW